MKVTLRGTARPWCQYPAPGTGHGSRASLAYAAPAEGRAGWGGWQEAQGVDGGQPPRSCQPEAGPGSQGPREQVSPPFWRRGGLGTAPPHAPPPCGARRCCRNSTGRWAGNAGYFKPHGGNSALPWRRGGCGLGRRAHLCSARGLYRGCRDSPAWGSACKDSAAVAALGVQRHQPPPALGGHLLTREPRGLGASLGPNMTGGCGGGRSCHLPCPGHTLLMMWSQTVLPASVLAPTVCLPVTHPLTLHPIHSLTQPPSYTFTHPPPSPHPSVLFTEHLPGIFSNLYTHLLPMRWGLLSAPSCGVLCASHSIPVPCQGLTSPPHPSS